ncbi:MAG: hypothetical protein LC118_11275 [Dehalococcoidia bacterium]|nr:hypothetical protein [Dehalococcoidia bacterium]
MRLWLKARRPRLCGAAILVSLAVLFVVSESTVPMPRLVDSAEAGLPVALMTPLLVVVAMAFSLTGGMRHAEAVSVRPVRALELLWVAGIVVVGLAGCVLVSGWSNTSLAPEAGRNLIGFTGLMLTGRVVVGSRAAGVVPVGYFVVASLLGRGSRDEVAHWAWAADGHLDSTDLTICLGLLVLGAGLQHTLRELGD